MKLRPSAALLLHVVSGAIAACSGTTTPDAGDGALAMSDRADVPASDAQAIDTPSIDTGSADVLAVDVSSLDTALDAAVIDAGASDSTPTDSGQPDASAPDAPSPDAAVRPLFLYTIRGGQIVRFPLTGAMTGEVVTAAGTWVSALSYDTVGDRLYWADSTANEIRSVAHDGTDARLFASTASISSLVDSIVVDVPGRAVFFAGNDGSSHGPVLRYPIATATPAMVADVSGFNGLSIDTSSRLYGITDDGRCDVDMRVVRLGTAGDDLRQGALTPAVRCASMTPAGADSATGFLYFRHNTALATGSCASGATSCVERVTVAAAVAGSALTITSRVSLVNGSSVIRILAAVADVEHGQLYFARVTTGASGAFRIVRSALDGTGEVNVTSFAVGTGSMYSTFGLPMIIAP